MLWIQQKRPINTAKGRRKWRGPSLTCCHCSATLHRKLPLTYHSSNPSLSFTVRVWGFRKQGLAFTNKGTIRSLSSARVGWLPKHFSNRSKHDKNELKLTGASTLSHTWNGHHFGTVLFFKTKLDSFWCPRLLIPHPSGSRSWSSSRASTRSAAAKGNWLSFRQKKELCYVF